MVKMSTNSSKIVFLIDQCLKIDNGEKIHSPEHVINIVRICVLKILSYFSNDRNPAASAAETNRACRLEWDVTYFRGESRRFRDKPRFREFTLKDFEAFETDLETRLFPTLYSAVSSAVDESQHVFEDGESDVLDSLKRALRSLAHDYSWDRPDILSPVKLSRARCTLSDRRKFLRTAPVESTDSKQNFAFVVAKCPRDADDLDISVLDSSAVLRSFLPFDLRQQFVDSLGIRLFWVDIDIDEQLVSMQFCLCRYVICAKCS